MEKLRVITLFSGYDSQCLALERLKQNYPPLFDYELVAWCEIDKNAIDAHNLLFPQWEDRNVGDICEVDPTKLPDCDLVTFSFPCQAISSAGLQGGLTEGSGTTSSLVWECFKIFKEKRPKFLLLENVKALIQKKFLPQFQLIQQRLEELGYTNFVKVLNAKDYGVPQNRERVFMVSVLNCEKPYIFPTPFPLALRLKDVLEENAPEEYYLSDDKVQRILDHCNRKMAEGCGFKPSMHEADRGGYSNTITSKYGNRETDPLLKIKDE